MLKKITAILTVCTSLLFSGVNSNTVFYVDMITETDSIEDIFNTSELNKEFEVVVRAKDVVNIKSFSIRLSIDGSKLEYLGAKEELSTQKNIIDGGMFFDDSDGEIIEYVGSVQGSGSTNSEGILGVFTFRSKLGMNDWATIEFLDVTLSDDENNLDEFVGASQSLNKGAYVVGVTSVVNGNNSVQKSEFISLLSNDVIINGHKLPKNSSLSVINVNGAVVKNIPLKKTQKEISMNKISHDIPAGFYIGILNVRNEKVVFKYSKNL